MKLEQIPRIRREDIQEAPDWIQKILDPLNRFIENIFLLTSSRIDYENNIQSQIGEYDISTAAIPVTFKYNMKQPPKGVFVMACFNSRNYNDCPAVQIGWNFDGTNISIVSQTGMTAGVDYKIRLLVI